MAGMFTELSETAKASAFWKKERQNSISSKSKALVSESPWFRFQLWYLWALLCLNFFIYKMGIITLHKQTCEVKSDQSFPHLAGHQNCLENLLES